MGFVGRSDELDQLAYWWERAHERPALVWGRRRVGKTALIERFASGLPRVVFHTAIGDPMGSELRRLSASVRLAGLQGLRDLASNAYHDWQDALNHLAAEAASEPMLLVLDEFPELLHGSPTLPGLLRAFLDRTRGRTQLRMLLCGSAVRTMWSIQGTREPLYGRFNLTLPVFPFRPHEAAMMLPGLPPERRALVYGLVGGMPLYLGWWQQQRSVAENLLYLVGNSGGPLLTEGRLIMETEIGSEQGGAVLYAIASGASKYSEIQGAVGFDPLRALDRLQEARLITRLVPAGEELRKSRRAIYRVADNFLAFYLGPVLKHRTEIERGRGRTVIPAIERELDRHLGLPYEDAFRECLWRKVDDSSLGLENIVEISPWWGTAQSGGRAADRSQVEIDAVLLAQPEQTRFPVAVGEAKWGKSVNGARLRAKLTAKAASVTPDVDRLRYIICARSEVVVPEGSDTVTITARDIFPDPA
ncbi:MAG: ATP-binding protein [Trebonia sp.]